MFKRLFSLFLVLLLVLTMLPLGSFAGTSVRQVNYEYSPGNGLVKTGTAPFSWDDASGDAFSNYFILPSSSDGIRAGYVLKGWRAPDGFEFFAGASVNTYGYQAYKYSDMTFTAIWELAPPPVPEATISWYVSGDFGAPRMTHKVTSFPHAEPVPSEILSNVPAGKRIKQIGCGWNSTSLDYTPDMTVDIPNAGNYTMYVTFEDIPAKDVFISEYLKADLSMKLGTTDDIAPCRLGPAAFTLASNPGFKLIGAKLCNVSTGTEVDTMFKSNDINDMWIQIPTAGTYIIYYLWEPILNDVRVLHFKEPCPDPLAATPELDIKVAPTQKVPFPVYTKAGYHYTDYIISAAERGVWYEMLWDPSKELINPGTWEDDSIIAIWPHWVKDSDPVVIVPPVDPPKPPVPVDPPKPSGGSDRDRERPDISQVGVKPEIPAPPVPVEIRPTWVQPQAPPDEPKEIVLIREKSYGITRQEVVHLFLDLLKDIDATGVSFPDSEDPLIAKAHKLGLVKGYSDGLFRPDQIVTNQEFEWIKSNYMSLLKEKKQ